MEVELSAGGDDPSALEAVRSLGLVAFSVREDEVAIEPALVLVRVLGRSLKVRAAASCALHTRSSVTLPYPLTLLVYLGVEVVEGELSVLRQGP